MAPGDLRQTPLNQWHRDHGAKMVEFGGWDMPVQYATGILQEHLATRRFGGLFDVSHMGRFRFGGAERIPFLQHVLSNNAEALEPWQAQYTLVPNERGGLVDDAYLYRFGDDDYLLVVNASNAEKDWDHFQAQARDFPGVVLENHTDALAMIAFQGPLAGRVLAELTAEDALPKPFHNALARVNLAGTETLIGRTGYTAEPICFELFVPADRAVARGDQKPGFDHAARPWYSWMSPPSRSRRRTACVLTGTGTKVSASGEARPRARWGRPRL